MPEKDLSTWSALGAALSVYGAQIYAFVLSAMIAAARVIYGGGKVREALLESLLCGLLTLAFYPVPVYFGLPEQFGIALGGCIAGLGSNFLRNIAERYVSRKSEK